MMVACPQKVMPLLLEANALDSHHSDFEKHDQQVLAPGGPAGRSRVYKLLKRPVTQNISINLG